MFQMYRGQRISCLWACLIGATIGMRLMAEPTVNPMPAKAPYKLLYNSDTSHTLLNVSPWHQPGEELTDRMIEAGIEEVAGHGVDCYIMSPGTGWVPWWPSKVDGDHWKWMRQTYGLEPGPYGRYIEQGGDMVAVMVKTCRRLGIAPFISMRMNDVHHLENAWRFNDRNPDGTPAVNPVAVDLISRFYVDNPAYLLDPGHARRRPYGFDASRGQNWMHPEVRQYKLRLIQELAANYDIDGIELDFLRDNHMFPLTGITREQRLAAMAEFVRGVRTALDSTTPPGKRRYLSVRIPSQAEFWDRQPLEDRWTGGAGGVDIAMLRACGVDMFNLSCWFNTCQRFDIDQVRQAAPDAAVYVEMTQSTGKHPYFGKDSGYGPTLDPRTSDYQFYTTAHLAYERGADGMSLYNFQYYRQHIGLDHVPVMEPPFHVLDRLADRQRLMGLPQQYFLAATAYFRQLPRTLVAGKSEVFTMDMAPAAAKAGWSAGWVGGPSAARAPVQFSRLLIHVKEAGSSARPMAASLNGVPLEAVSHTGRILGNPFDRMISPDLSHRFAWRIPPGVVRNGLNELTLQLPDGKPLTVIYVEIELI